MKKDIIFDIVSCIPQDAKEGLEKRGSEFIKAYTISNSLVESKLTLINDKIGIEYKSHEKDCKIDFSAYEDGDIFVAIKCPNEKIHFSLNLHRIVSLDYDGERRTNNPIIFNGKNAIRSFKADCYDGFMEYCDMAINGHELTAYGLRDSEKYNEISEEYLVQKYGQAYYRNANLLLADLLIRTGIDEVKGMPTVIEVFQIALKELDTVYNGLWDYVSNMDAIKTFLSKIDIKLDKGKTRSIPKREFFKKNFKPTELNIDEVKEALNNPKLLDSVIDEYDDLPYEFSEKLIDDFFGGNLDKIDVKNINQLIAAGLYYNDYYLLLCSIKSCNIKNEHELLYFIIDYMCGDYMDPIVRGIADIDEIKKHISRVHNSYPTDLYEREYTLDELVDVKKGQLWTQYKDLLLRAAFFASSNGNVEFFDRYKDSPIDWFRIALSGFTPNPEAFMNDKNRRVQKIVNLRTGFDSRMSQKTEDERTIINYITSLFNEGKISCIDGALAYKDENGNFTDEYVCAKFEGDYLNSDYIDRFDEDVFGTIKDKSILAESLLEYLKRGVITLTNVPEYCQTALANLGIIPEGCKK